MTAPPGTLARAESLPDNRQVGETAPTSKREAYRYLRAELGITGAQAHALYAAYARDVEDARRIGNDTHRSDEDFLAWLMQQAPGGRMRAVRKWSDTKGGGWAVRS